MKVLGIESSCDETAVAVVEDGRHILSNIVASQQQLHRKYGGVVPEIAARAHIEAILPVLDEALDAAGATFDDIDVIAVTDRPGLVGALLIGISAAKAIAWARQKPLVAVDHVRAHIYAYRLQSDERIYPCVGLIASGGHTLLTYSESETECKILGTTNDDAAGEAFDKVASILELGYPGGPVIDRLAKQGNPEAFKFPRSYLEPGSLNFSFSGIKTAVLYHWKGQDGKKQPPPEVRGSIEDVAASFQEAVVDVLVDKTMLAAEQSGVNRIIIGGGVACNSRLRETMQSAADARGFKLFIPSVSLCTDNAAMTAGLGYHIAQAGEFASLDLEAKPGLIR